MHGCKLNAVLCKLAIVQFVGGQCLPLVSSCLISIGDGYYSVAGTQAFVVSHKPWAFFAALVE